MPTKMPPQGSSAAPTHATARWVDGERFLTTGSSGHAIVIDSNRAWNSAPGPMELVLRSLCACTATDLVIVLKKARQAWTELDVSAEAERAATPPTVFTRIHLRYRVVGRNLDRAAVERAVNLSQAKYCSVSIMLSRTAPMSHEITVESDAAPAP